MYPVNSVTLQNESEPLTDEATDTDQDKKNHKNHPLLPWNMDHKINDTREEKVKKVPNVC